MAINVSFLNDGTAHDARDFGAYFNKFVKDGVYTTPANALVVTNPTGLQFNVAPGSAFVLGVWVENTSSIRVTADSTPSQRVDRIVVRVDHGVPVGEITLLKGTDGSLTPPTLANSAAKKELCLAEVTITKLGVTAMRDTRSDTDLCGFVQNFLGSTDASGLFDTWENEFQRVIANANSNIDNVVDEAQTVFQAVEAESAGLFGSDGRQGFINPAFHIDQRGAETYSLQTGTQKAFDKWVMRIGGRRTNDWVTASRVQDGSRTALMIETVPYATGSTASGASCLLQNIENGVQTFCNGKQFTVSFDAKADSPQRIAVEPVQFENEAATGVTLPAQIVEVGTQWQRHSVTFQSTLNSTAMEDVLKIGFFFAWINYTDRFGSLQNATNNIYFSNMQINEGTEALPAYIPPVWADLQACRRYLRTSGMCQLVVSGHQTTTGNQVRTQELDFGGMRTKPNFTFADRVGNVGKASLFNVSGLHIDNCATISSSNSSEGISLVITNTGVSAIAAVLRSWIADADFTV